MQYSTNYHMNLPDGTDRYNVEDFNANIRIIDANMKSISDASDSSSSSVNNLAGRLTAVETKANTNANNISNLSTRVSTVEGKTDDLDTINSNITSLKTRATNLETKTTTLENELTANGNRIYMDYQNGKYGYNTSAERGADTFHVFSSKNAKVITETWEYTVTSTGSGLVSFNRTKTLSDFGISIDDFIGCYISYSTCGPFTNNGVGEVRARLLRAGKDMEWGASSPVTSDRVEVVWRNRDGMGNSQYIPNGYVVTATINVVYYG